MPAILVLEDDANMREILVETLEDEGHEVKGAGSAAAALEEAGRARFDLVVADVRMAGMDGIDCLGALKQARPDLKCLVITGYTDEDAPLRAISIEVDDYLFKPFELHDFQTRVRRLLGAGQERAGYSEMVDRFLAGYRRIVRKAGEARLAAHLNAIEAERTRAYNHFMVAIRSRLLLPGGALKIWDQLEQLEEARERLRTSDEGAVDWQKIRDGFKYMADLVLAMARSRANDPVGPRAEGQITRESFTALYQRVQGGQVSLEQLKLAPLVRTLGSEALRGSPEMHTLHRELWAGAA